jgi:hypothetical protein
MVHRDIFAILAVHDKDECDDVENKVTFVSCCWTLVVAEKCAALDRVAMVSHWTPL